MRFSKEATVVKSYIVVVVDVVAVFVIVRMVQPNIDVDLTLMMLKAHALLEGRKHGLTLYCCFC